MIAVKKFKLNNFMSTDFPNFDLICDCSVGDSESGEVSSYLAREAVASESYRGEYKRVHNLKYTDVFTFKITILRGDFGDFSVDEQRQIFSWLTSKNTATMIDFYDDIYSNIVAFSILGMPTEIESYKLANNRTIGYVVTFQSVNPWALSQINTVTKNITAPQTFIINCHTDNYESLVYPKVVITEGAGVIVQADHAMTDISEHINGTVYHYENVYYWINSNNELQQEANAPLVWNTTSTLIKNETTNTQTKIGGNVTGEIITLDGANRVVSSSATTRILDDDFNWVWLPLKRGNNSIKITGNCTVQFTWREPIKIGEW